MFTTSDGRTLSYDDVGDPTGTPVIYLHGTPDSRLARHPDDGVTGEAGVRLLAVDRPGYGGTSAPPADWPARQVHEQFAGDLAALLDELGLQQASLLAWSGGTLAALAAAVATSLAGRLTGLTIVAGVAPREAHVDPAVREATPGRLPLLDLADETPKDELAEMVAHVLAPYPCDMTLAAEHQREQRSLEDQAALAAIPGGVEQMAAALVEAVKHGLAGVGFDAVAQNYPDAVPPLDQVDLPVRLYYGSDDQVAPPALGQWYETHLPQTELEVVEGAGHFLFFTHWREILATLTTH